MIIVTGGAGFIGSRIIKGLNDRNFKDILLVDDFRPEILGNVNDIEFTSWLCPSKLSSFIASNASRIKSVYHYGAESSTTCTDGEYIYENNYEYTKDLIDICTKNNIPLQIASSAAVYGNSEVFSDASDDYTPTNIYGYAKLLNDRHVRRFIDDKKYKSPIQTLRLFNVISDGEFESHKEGMQSPLAWMTRQAEQHGKITLFEGSDEYKRDFIHVDSVVDLALELMLSTKKHIIKGVFNIGMGESHSFQEVAEGIFEGLAKKAEIEYVPMPEEIKGHYQKFTLADISLHKGRVKMGMDLFQERVISLVKDKKGNEDTRRFQAGEPAFEEQEEHYWLTDKLSELMHSTTAGDFAGVKGDGTDKSIPGG
jgi:ADP-L-glycero-D-manno-heptose 6-epimerase